MEDLMRKQACMPTSTSSLLPPLAMRQNSHTITKVKPKIRIIHIFAPEIIKTDVANFRELVQRLTGKPSTHDQKGSSTAWKKKPIRRARLVQENCNNNSNSCDHHHNKQTTSVVMTKTVELRTGFGSLGSRERVKEEEPMWNNGENSGGFLGGFADLDGFIQELGDFPLLPLDANHHMMMQGLEETQLA